MWWYDKFQELLRRHVRHFEGRMSADAERAIDALERSAALHAEKVSRAGRELSNRLKSKAVGQLPVLPKATPRRGLDLFGVCALAVLAGLVLGTAYAALHFGWFRSPWELAGWLFFVVAFLVVALGTEAPPPPQNHQVHGTAKPANVWETKAAARGDTKAPLHGRDFED